MSYSQTCMNPFFQSKRRHTSECFHVISFDCSKDICSNWICYKSASRVCLWKGAPGKIKIKRMSSALMVLKPDELWDNYLASSCERENLTSAVGSSATTTEHEGGFQQKNGHGLGSDHVTIEMCWETSVVNNWKIKTVVFDSVRNTAMCYTAAKVMSVTTHNPGDVICKHAKPCV